MAKVGIKKAKKSSAPGVAKKKKVVVKKSVSKAVRKGASKPKLVQASAERCFWIHEGPVLRDLKELERSFGKMTVMQFAYHAPGDRNDFADWVLHVLLDKDCSAALRLARTKEESQKIVKQYLKQYK